MAEGLNRALLLGNLGADPELRFTQGGTAVLNIRLATTESFLDRDRQRQERTEWHNVTVWGKRAEALSKFLRKGNRIFVEGGIRTSSYDDRDGNKRYKTEIVASNIILSGGKREKDDEGESRGSGRGRGSGGGYGGSHEDDYGGRDYGSDAGEGDDDIPF
jgi:single-strand DNA-binding protein